LKFVDTDTGTHPASITADGVNIADAIPRTLCDNGNPTRCAADANASLGPHRAMPSSLRPKP
jgi:hypothetical protein